MPVLLVATTQALSQPGTIQALKLASALCTLCPDERRCPHLWASLYILYTVCNCDNAGTI